MSFGVVRWHRGGGAGALLDIVAGRNHHTVFRALREHQMAEGRPALDSREDRSPQRAIEDM